MIEWFNMATRALEYGSKMCVITSEFYQHCLTFPSTKNGTFWKIWRVLGTTYDIIVLVWWTHDRDCKRKHIHRDHVLSQWEVMSHCNVISHWQGAFTKWFMHTYLRLLSKALRMKWCKACWNRMPPTTVRKHAADWIIINSDNGLAPVRCQAISLTNADLLSIWPVGINFGEILIKIYKFSFKIMHFKMSSAKRRPFCSVVHVLMGSTMFVITMVIIWLSHSYGIASRSLNDSRHEKYHSQYDSICNAALWLWKKLVVETVYHENSSHMTQTGRSLTPQPYRCDDK